MAHISLWRDLRETADMIKFQHTIFALPFALIALVEANRTNWPQFRVWFWVIVAMVGARTAAMSFNRLTDAEIDAANNRTANRALPAGRLSRRYVIVVTVLACSAFGFAAFMLNSLCAKLSFPVLAILLGYSWAKRFTAASHLWLGLALGLAPVGAWIAAVGQIALPPIVLGSAVLFWVAGFDIIYSLQDAEFDREHGLHSIPALLGRSRALVVARFFHGIALVGFGCFSFLLGGGGVRWAAVFAAGVLLVWQHHLVKADDLSRVDAAFFTANGVLSLLMGLLFFVAHALGMAAAGGAA